MQQLGVRLVPGDRAALAHSAGKPLLLEEFGAQRQYITPRDALIHRCSVWMPQSARRYIVAMAYN